MTSPETNPRSVTPGIETHVRVELDEGMFQSSKLPPPGTYVGLDWIRCTGPEVLRSSVENLIHERVGGDPKPANGAKWFKVGVVWESGVLLSWEHRNEICQVDIQGQCLRLMDGTARVDLLGSLLALGMKLTRVDGALDFVGQELDICEDATASCRRGELCILRKYSPNDEFTSQGVPTRRLLKLGSRGSPVCGRIYDKGLEQGLAPAGHYERLEIEWKQDRAPQVGEALLKSGEAWSEVLVALILGSIEFRKENGRSELERRPIAGWWARLTAGHKAVRIAPSQEDESFERWNQWARVAMWPRVLELAAAVHATVPEVVTQLVRGVQAGRNGGRIVRQFETIYQNSKA